MIKQRLGDVVTIQAGHPFRGSIPDVPDGPIQVVQMRDMNIDTGIIWDRVMRTNFPNGRISKLETGDILFLSRGEKLIAEALNDVPDNSICSPHFFVIKLINPKVLMSNFLAWQINQGPSQQYFKTAAEGSGQLSIRRTILESLPVVIPTIKHQIKLLRLAELVQREQMVMSELLTIRQQQLHILLKGLLMKEQPQEDAAA